MMNIIDRIRINRNCYGLKRALLAEVVEATLRPRWVVNDGGEMGFRIGPVAFRYYKWPDPTADFASSTVAREAGKREFGEVVVSRRVVTNCAPRRRCW